MQIKSTAYDNIQISKSAGTRLCKLRQPRIAKFEFGKARESLESKVLNEQWLMAHIKNEK